MQTIQVLDNHTIDQIAAGEVVERPASIVKELVENAMDAGADSVTVEIRGGGIDFIRVTDNGCGIGGDEIPVAFLRHATSKIRDISDLEHLHSMGFRGEALASIASVCKLRMITKRPGELMGHKYELDGGKDPVLEEIGAPDGTTVIAAHLFFNTPVRRKFLKSATAEGNAIAELMERLALGRPDISFKFVQNGNTRFMTSGSGDLKEVIHRIYGREAVRSVVPVSREVDGIRIDGYLGTPSMNRPNRNFENYFLNSRYIKSDLVSRSIEEGYKGYMMQHKFPFCVLHIQIDSTCIDVNVHPSKMDVRFHDREGVFNSLCETVAAALHDREMIPESLLDEPEKGKREKALSAPEPFETKRREEEEREPYPQPAAADVDAADEETVADGGSLEKSAGPEEGGAGESSEKSVSRENRDIFDIRFDDESGDAQVEEFQSTEEVREAPHAKSESVPEDPYKNAKQLEMLPKERVISAVARKQYRLIGCIFNTYWMFSWQDKLYFVDQHAAHEKVRYEHLMAQYEARKVYVQQLAPPIILSLSPTETDTLREYRSCFEELGFATEDFGGSEIAISSVPMELYRKDPKTLFLEILNDLSLKGTRNAPNVIDRVLATMACKGAVKGGDVISAEEMDAVLDELLTLKNPYHCPHGRPTIFSMSRSELERKFKRIVN
ncbi:MAG: DNA mismatch repair endonuclease MutL [Lachnospiraceae bacterium]|nr:DNA mismatch repair endonuclease MutL [Lachnospiraceae bacterium]